MFASGTIDNMPSWRLLLKLKLAESFVHTAPCVHAAWLQIRSRSMSLAENHLCLCQQPWQANTRNGRAVFASVLLASWACTCQSFTLPCSVPLRLSPARDVRGMLGAAATRKGCMIKASMSHGSHDDQRPLEAAASAIKMYSPAAKGSSATIKQLELDMVSEYSVLRIPAFIGLE